MTTPTDDLMPWETAPPEDVTPAPDPVDDVVEASLVTVVDKAGLVVDADTLLNDLGTDHTARSAFVADLSDAVTAAVRNRSDTRREARRERLQGDEPESATDLRRELVGAANDADTLKALAGVFASGAKEAELIAGDLLTELPKRTYRGQEKPVASVKVGDGEGFELKVARTQPTKAFCEVDDVVEILVAWGLRVAESATRADAGEGPLALGKMPAVTYSAGFRDGIAMLRAIIPASPDVKSTALDSLVTALEAADEEDLAARLRKAYGRKDYGEATVKLSREAKEVKS